MINKNEDKLIGKTIVKAVVKGLEPDEDKKVYDDKPILELTMKDGSVFNIISDYKKYTGRSKGEYPRVIKVKENKLK